MKYLAILLIVASFQSYGGEKADIFMFCYKGKFALTGKYPIDPLDSYADCLSEAKKFEKYCSNNQKDCFKNLWWSERKRIAKRDKPKKEVKRKRDLELNKK